MEQAVRTRVREKRAVVVNDVQNDPQIRHKTLHGERGIRYVPDYVANAGGVISGSVDIAGWDLERMNDALGHIYLTVREVFALAANLNVGTHAAADRMAEARLAAAQSQSRWGGGAEA